jgi:hypothetical protein
MVRVHLIVAEREPFNTMGIYDKWLDWPGVPDVGEYVYVVLDKEDDFALSVAKRSWEDDGPTVYLQTVIIDPSEMIEREFSTRPVGGSWFRQYSPWRTDADRDGPFLDLTQHGWEKR